MNDDYFTFHFQIAHSSPSSIAHSPTSHLTSTHHTPPHPTTTSTDPPQLEERARSIRSGLVSESLPDPDASLVTALREIRDLQAGLRTANDDVMRLSKAITDKCKTSGGGDGSGAYKP